MTAGALVLTPGAGGGRDQRTLVAIDHAVQPLPVSRVDFPYILQGRKIPDKPPVAIAHLRMVSAALLAEARARPDQLVLGGRSFGGRMCSMAVADGLPAAGLVLLSYPLHPPGKTEALRVEHFPRITVPTLFVGGSADPFGSPAEFDSWTATIPGPVTQVWVPGGHAPGVKAERTIVDTVRDWIASL